MWGHVALFVALADARPLELRASPSALVIALPQAQPHRAEIGLYGNRENVSSDVATWRADGLVRAEVAEVAGGISFIVVELEHPDRTLAVSGPVRGVWTVSIVRREVAAPDEMPVLTASELLSGLPRRPNPGDPARLHPLSGDAAAYGLIPSTVPLPEVVPPFALQEPDAPSWDQVQEWREELSYSRGDVAIPVLWKLARAHRVMGFPRESMYYYRRLSALTPTDPQPHLARADAALAVGSWDIVRAECGEAVALGADEVATLPCLALLSLATSEPPPAQAARALAAVAQRPLDRLVAGILLLRDGYAAEAIPLLAEATETVSEGSRPVAFVALGDAQFSVGSFEDARAAYLATPPGSLDRLLETRRLMMGMQIDGARRWPAWVPALTGLAEKGGPAAPDALYLLAQVHGRYGDPGAQAAVLAALWDADPAARRTDVPSRLLEACGARIRQLERESRHAELVATWEACWRNDLRPWVVQMEPLAAVSLAWQRMGFLEEALEVQILLVQILAGREREDPAQFVRLAELRIQTGKADQAVDTVAYARALEPGDEVTAALDLELGRALALLGREDEAIAAFEKAASLAALDRVAGAEAAALLLRTGDCVRGVARAAPLLALGPIGGQSSGNLELLSANCRATLGDPIGAIADAGLALDRALDETTRAEARWLATAVHQQTGSPIPDRLKSEGKPWTELSTENERHAAFLQSLAEWRRGAPVDP